MALKSKDCLIVLAKDPVPGLVKTRLHPHLTLREAAGLYEAFVEDVFRTVLSLPRVQKVVAYSGRGQGLKRLTAQDCHWIPQGAGDLGARMMRAFQWSHNQGFRRTILIGTDSPNLPSSYIRNSFRLLRKSDVVVGPAWDGGFYILGMKPPLVKGVLEGIEWSKSSTLLHTIQKMKSLGKKTEILPAWYDVDVVGDLDLLRLDLLCHRSQSRACRQTLKALIRLGMMN